MMNEKEREEEIFKRAEKREMLKKRYEIEKKLKLQKKSTKEENKTVNKALDTKERSRARKEAVENKSKDKKASALDMLKAKRKEKQEQQQKIEEKKKKAEETDKKKWKTNDIYSSDSSDDEIEKDRSRSPERKRSSSSSSSASSSSASSRSRTPSPIRRTNIKSHQDLEKMRFTRTKLERWCHLPYFDEVVVGGFVRLTIGTNGGKSVYRVCEIMEVIEGNKIYQLGKTRTNKILKVRHAQQERTFRMEYVSQGMFTESEFTKWKVDTMTSGIMIPSIEEADNKKKQIDKFNNRRMTDKDIHHMLKEKERFMQNPRNYAMYKSKLSKDRDSATTQGNFEEADRLSSRLNELEERAEGLDKARSERISTIALINDRNRKDNIAKAEEDIRIQIASKNKHGETCDPFTRRKTKPTLATAVIARKQHAMANGIEIPKPIRNLTKDTHIRAKSMGSGASGEDKKENQPDAKTKDLFSAHDFDIDINLDSFTPNSAIKLNLTTVNTSKQDIGPKKSLNLSDYKKKRGLI